jgi:hypothetical protein
MSETATWLVGELLYEGSLGGLPVIRWLPLESLRPRHGWVAFDASDARVVSAARHAYAAHVHLRGTVRGSGCEVVLTDRLERVGDAVYRWEEFPPDLPDETRPEG